MRHPGTCNDKTLILVDGLIIDVQNNSMPDDFEFEIYERKVNGGIERAVYNVIWFMVDNECIS